MNKRKPSVFQNLPEGTSFSGLLLIFCTTISLIFANQIFKQAYLDFWNYELCGKSLLHLINDGLMTVFFLVVGLEIKKELQIGELSNFKKAFLPLICALGGMIAPAAIYLALNFGTKDISGWGIPTATDIAFSIGILAILGSRIPHGLKVFLTALAIIDDLGAVVVIALFYSHEISFIYLSCAIGLTVLLWILLKFANYYNIIVWIIAGCGIWYFLHHSGIHSTIAGVLLATVIPIKYKNTQPLEKIAEWLHKPVNYFIIPLFAIANTAIIINGDVISAITSTISLGIILGLFVGKPLGIMFFAYVSTKFGWAELPNQVNWKLLLGAAILAGIGFTMSMFVSFLAFQDAYRQDVSKIAILIGSLLASVVGLIYLNLVLKNKDKKARNTEGYK
jgi:Na+:H+ antiporter, NhaA family